jgi:hypothetical protein
MKRSFFVNWETSVVLSTPRRISCDAEMLATYLEDIASSLREQEVMGTHDLHYWRLQIQEIPESPPEED